MKGVRFLWSKWRDSASLRNLNRRCSRLERARRSFRLIRSPLFAYGDAPLGRRSARSPTALQAACPNPRLDMQNPGYPQGASGILCRSGGIRTRGLLVPNSRIWISDRPMRVFAIFPRLCNEKPRISENFRFFHAIFKVDILPFRLILKVQFGVQPGRLQHSVQPGRLQHSPGHALPFGQSCTPSNSLILLFFSSTRALERPYIRSTSFASRMN